MIFQERSVKFLEEGAGGALVLQKRILFKQEVKDAAVAEAFKMLIVLSRDGQLAALDACGELIK